MCCAVSSVFYFSRQSSYYMYKFIYQFSSFQFNSNLMLWWKETDANIKPWSIMVISALVCTLIPHDSGLPVAQLFLWIMVFPLLGITFLFAVIICTYFIPKCLVFRILYLCTYCVFARTLAFFFIGCPCFPHSILA